MATTKTIQVSGVSTLVMFGAGLCTALLFTVLRQGTFQAMALGHVTPLPIMISTLGFGPVIGFGSAAVAALTLAVLSFLHGGLFSIGALLSGLVVGAIFALILALPAWWLSFVPSLARLDGMGRWTLPPPDKKNTQFSFYPIGRIPVHAAVIAICLTGLVMGSVIMEYGGFEPAAEGLAAKLLPYIEQLIAARPELGTFDIHMLTQLTLKTMPAVLSGWILVMLLGNLWLAGRVVQTSNRLRRPWPDIPREMRMPRLLVLALAAGLALSFVKDWLGIAGLTIAVTFAMTYALHGAAVLHDLSRGWRWRIAILCAVYSTLLFIPWPLVLFALIGLADTAYSLRGRKAAAPQVSKP